MLREFEFGQGHEVRKDAAKLDCACRIQVCGVEIEVSHGCEMRQGTEGQSSTRRVLMPRPSLKVVTHAFSDKARARILQPDSPNSMPHISISLVPGSLVSMLCSRCGGTSEWWSALLPPLEPRERVAEGWKLQSC